MTTITASFRGVGRGEYLWVDGRGVRVTRVVGATLTVRSIYRFRVVEWAVARCEDLRWMLQPTPDLGRKP